MRFAYADPPYIGQAAKHYDMPEVNHPQLIASLQNDYPDGWALSCSSVSLREIIEHCPATIRVMAWVKPFCSFKPGVNPAYAWEPVLVQGGRKRTREQETVRDWVSAVITLKKGLPGAKPEAFVLWLISVLNMQTEDELTDIFPGTGIVGRVVEQWRAQAVMNLNHGG